MRPVSSVAAAFAIASATLVIACAATPIRPNHPTDDEKRLGRAVEDTLYFGAARRHAPGVVVERTPQASVLIRRVERAGHPAPARVDDGLIEQTLRGVLSMDPLAVNHVLDVDVDDGVVKLSGAVRDAGTAGRVIGAALDVDGVRAVDSRLTWVPERRAVNR